MKNVNNTHSAARSTPKGRGHTRFCLLFASLSLSTAALAEDRPSDAPMSVEKPARASDDVQHNVSLTFSPVLLLANGVLETTAEFRLSSYASIAVSAGLGSLNHPATLGLVGLQGRVYPVGTFIHGMSLALDVQYIAASLDDGSGTGNGIVVSPMIGYKLATNRGFTLDLQAGPAMLVVRAAVSNGDTAVGRAVLPKLNLNLGWSL